MKNNIEILTLDQINDRLDIMEQNINYAYEVLEVLEKLVAIQKTKK